MLKVEKIEKLYVKLIYQCNLRFSTFWLTLFLRKLAEFSAIWLFFFLHKSIFSTVLSGMPLCKCKKQYTYIVVCSVLLLCTIGCTYMFYPLNVMRHPFIYTNTLLEKFWRVSLYVTDATIAKLYVT